MGEWLAKRRQLGVGSSEVPALFSYPGEYLRGMSYYESRYSLWTKKMGMAFLEPQEESDPAYLEWKRREAEEAVARWFARVVAPAEGCEVADPGPYTLAKHPELPLFSTVDRLTDGDIPVEIKNPEGYNLSEWKSEPPIAYALQVQAQLMVFDAPFGYICASIGGGLPRWAKIKADPQMQAIIAREVTQFWREVEAGEEPEVDGHRMTSKALVARYPTDDGETITLPVAAATAWRKRELLRKYRKRAKAKYDAYTNAVRQAMGDATYGELPAGGRVSYKAGADGRRRFREVAD